MMISSGLYSSFNTYSTSSCPIFDGENVSVYIATYKRVILKKYFPSLFFLIYLFINFSYKKKKKKKTEALIIINICFLRKKKSCSYFSTKIYVVGTH